ncbi:hypothetical protein, partial [Frankia sp. CiP3]|uniref:hypothetical protein n=1 Tax=Frankia sp. CiP3 TaxID=2880971 RepID=UPI001EF4F300
LQPRPGWGDRSGCSGRSSPTRPIAANGDFDAYYAHRLREEQQRVHYSKYQEAYSELPSCMI